jgi:hypothetical protein
MAEKQKRDKTKPHAFVSTPRVGGTHVVGEKPKGGKDAKPAKGAKPDAGKED